MKRASLITISALVLVVISACKNKLDLNAPYKEIPSVYAVINPQESVHIIRVNKIFLGEGDANIMAKVADSVNYAAGELTITLDRFEAGSDYTKQINACPTCIDNPNTPINEKRTIVFRDSVIQAQPGAFSTTQRVYVSNSDLHDSKAIPGATDQLNTNPNWKVSGDYVLTIKNNRSGNTFRARSTAVDSVRPVTSMFRWPFYPYPNNLSPFTDADKYLDFSETEKLYDIRFTPNEGQVYQVIMRLNFYEDFAGQRGYRSVDYAGNFLYPKDARKLSTGTYLVSEFRGKDIYNAVQAGLKNQGLTDQVQGRRMYMVELFVYSSTLDFVDYQEFVKPSFNISQNKPIYSNFENRDALGIFTFRSRCMVRKEFSYPYINSFSDHPLTCYYKFLTTDNIYRGCK